MERVLKEETERERIGNMKSKAFADVLTYLLLANSYFSLSRVVLLAKQD